MKIRQQKLLMSAGVISTVLGITFLIPSFVKEIWILAVVSALMMVVGLILMSIAFGD